MPIPGKPSAAATRYRVCRIADSPRVIRVSCEGDGWHHDPVATVPELRGDRVLLNAHAEEDAAAHAAGEDEETARRFGWWPARSTEETVRAAYADWARNWRDDGPTRAFAARDPETGALVGGCELRISPDGTGEVSYWTHAGKRGRGHARNALALLLGYAASIGVTRLEAHVATDNHASRRVAESAGFTQACTFTDDDGTEMIRYTREVPRPRGGP
jgi:RimJ/RimL family protein N-acetyltransferase